MTSREPRIIGLVRDLLTPRESEQYHVEPFPAIRRAYVDVLNEGHRHHTIHGLVELDVTKARAALAAAAAEGRSLSFTGFITACVARAVDENKLLHAHRWGRRRLVLFADVDVNLQLEQTEADGTSIVQSRIVRAANRKDVREISEEIRAAAELGPRDRRRLRGTRGFVKIPGFIRSWIWRAVMARPWWTKRFGGTVAISSVGMFGSGLGWGIPISPAPLMVTVGGIGSRPAVIEGELVEREFLSVTISVDHDVVDGAPAARFVQRLRELVETPHGLDDRAMSTNEERPPLGSLSTLRARL